MVCISIDFYYSVIYSDFFKLSGLQKLNLKVNEIQIGPLIEIEIPEKEQRERRSVAPQV